MVNLNNLFARIDELNLTAKKVADDTGISTGNISDWKSGRSMPTATKLDILASYLHCSVDYILGRTDCPEVNTKKESSEDGSLEDGVVIRAAARDGRMIEKVLTFEQAEQLIYQVEQLEDFKD